MSKDEVANYHKHIICLKLINVKACHWSYNKRAETNSPKNNKHVNNSCDNSLNNEKIVCSSRMTNTFVPLCVSVLQSWSEKPPLLTWHCSSPRTSLPSRPMESASPRVTLTCGGSSTTEACWCCCPSFSASTRYCAARSPNLNAP